MYMQWFKKIINNPYFKWINIIVIGIYFLTIMAIDIKGISGGADWYKEITWIKIITNQTLIIIISAYIVLIPGYQYLLVYKKLLRGKLHMDILIALAIHISFIFSLSVVIFKPGEALIIEPIGLLYIFDTIGKEIEEYINRKNNTEKLGLESLKDTKVTLKNNITKDINDVKVNDILLFNKDDIIQFDGVISQGIGIIDTSNINGESNPYYAKVNSNIISGSKVLSDNIYLKVQKTFQNSTLNKLIQMINKTNHVKPNIQIAADKIAKKFIPLVLIITLLTFIVWISIGNIANINPFVAKDNSNIYNAFFVSISVLAIACPCAMTMTAPLISYVSAQSYWRNNIVFNKVKDMEKINKVTDIILDKTGTLTTNEMEIIQEFGDLEYHKISAAIEESVFHPVALAIFKKYESKIIVNKIVEKSGEGVKAEINFDKYFIGRVSDKDLEKTFKESIKHGTYVGLFKNKILVAGYVLESELNPNAYNLIKYFKLKNIKPIIISGDNKKSTKDIANKLNINYKYGQSPEDKAKYIQKLQSNGKIVMAIGDGLNDSIAIKYADVSCTFASGSSITNSYSSITFLSSDLNNAIYLFKMAKKNKTNYMIAILWALGFNILFIPFAAFGLIYPFLSALIMYISNVILFFIIFNFSRILKKLEIKIYGRKTKTKVEHNHEHNVEDHGSMDHCNM